MQQGPSSRREEEEECEAVLTLAPDGGYGWFIVFICFLGSMICDGVAFSLYLFRDLLAKELQVDPTAVSAVFSIYFGVNYFVGPLVSGLSNRYGFRTTMVIGGILTAGAMYSSYFGPNLVFYYVVIGIIGGIGGGFLYIPALVPVNFWFDKKRPIAVGIACSGSGVGVFAIQKGLIFWMEFFYWKTSFFLLGGLFTFAMFLGIFLKPLPVTRLEVQVQDGKSTKWQGTVKSQNRITSKSQRFHPNTPTALKALQDSHYRAVREGPDRRYSAISPLGGRGLSVPRVSMFTVPGERNRCAKCCACCKCCDCDDCESKCCNRKTHKNRPLYRKDIFYYGSVYRLKDQVKLDNRMNYAMSVSKLPRTTDIAEETEGTCVCCPEAAVRTCLEMFDVKLFKSVAFILLGLNSLFFQLGSLIPFAHMSDNLLQPEMTHKAIHYLVPTIGIGNFFGRLLCGFLLQLFPNLKAHTLYTALTLLMGITTTICFGVTNIYYQFVYCFLFGFSYGMLIPMRSLVIVDFLGIGKLTNATGLIFVFCGIGNTVGGPVGELFKERVPLFRSSFLWSGSTIILSGFVLVLMRLKKPHRTI